MAAGLEDSSPRYLSARSSDVILSDIRPIKLKVEALRSVNAFLDELLWNIISIARSLSTDRLKASLLKTLPTTLGKEALLEAEVELKAYWERTNPLSNPHATVVEGEDFPLEWSFELLRLKCEAYSTLNDSDEDFNAENRLSERMRDMGCLVPPPAALVAPAALYLTAVIEYICEHILSNVSRVVARDSSRASATPHDLFVALCEDSTIYSAFKVMKVYDHIENLQKTSRPRRSKSFSREKFAPTSSFQSDFSANARDTPTSQSRTRMSADSMTSGATAVQPSRPSIDKAKTKLFGHSKTPSDVPDYPSLHKRTESGYSDSVSGSFDLEDQAMMDEFDELMRSGTTMKVSLTPDRLKSMEVYNKEKKRGIARRPGSSKREATNGNYEELPVALLEAKRAAQRMPALRHVDSIVEDEEEAQIHTATSTAMRSFPSTPISQKFSTQPTPHMADANGRVRSQSTTQAPTKLLRKSSWATSSKGKPPPPPKSTDDRPARTRKPQRNIENMDIDDILNGSEDEDAQKPSPGPPSSYKGPTKATGPANGKISQSAQELVDFLAEGPPPEPSFPGRASPQNIPKQKSGRLGRMMSKLTGAPSNERLREEVLSKKTNSVSSLSSNQRSNGYGQPSSFAQSSIPAVGSNPGFIIATPPRPPRPIESIVPVSPPATPGSPTRESFAIPESRSLTSAPKVVASRKTASPFEASRGDPMRLAPPSRQSSRGSPFSQSKESLHSVSSTGHAINGRVNGSGLKRDNSLSEQSQTDNDVPANDNKLEDEVPIAAPLLTIARVDELRRLLSNATSADECRVLTDMFLARVGFPVKRIGEESPYPVPTPDLTNSKQEDAMVEILLGDSPTESESSFSTPVEMALVHSHITPVVRPIRNDSRNASLQNIQDTLLHQHSQRTLAVA